jgi:phosphate transport system permease protein
VSGSSSAGETEPTLPGDSHLTHDRPRTTPFPWARVAELAASAVAAAAVVWTPFHLVRLNAPFGFVICWFAAFAAIFGVVVRQRHGQLELKDGLATVVVWTGLLLALLPLGLLLGFVMVKGAKVVFTNFPSFPFLRQDMRHWSPSGPSSRAGMKAAMIGTVEQVGLATMASVPLGVLAATYINEIGGRYATVVRTIADAMTGLPSIIAGLLIYFLWVIPLAPNGNSGFAAAMALTIVMLPTVVRTAEEVLRLVSDSLREAALALGAPEWRTVMQVVIPTARTGLVTAAILGVARAIGETAPVLFTAFGNPRTVLNPFSGKQADMPYTIYQLARAPRGSAVAVGWGGALVLMAIILTLFTLARILGTGAPGSRPIRSRKPQRVG